MMATTAATSAAANAIRSLGCEDKCALFATRKEEQHRAGAIDHRGKQKELQSRRQ